MTSIILESPATLSPSLQDIARNYLAAQKRSGDALLEAASWLAKAREQARHGEWGVFLEATRTSEGTAGRLLHIHALAQTDPQFAEAVRTNWLAATAAAELAQPSVAPEVRQRLLSQDEAPTRADVRAAKSATVAEMEPAPADPADPRASEARQRAAALGLRAEVTPAGAVGLYFPDGKIAGGAVSWEGAADLLTRREQAGAKSATVAEMEAKPGVYFWGQIRDALESHQWRRVAPGRWEARCEKITNHEPGPGTGRRCLDCANGAPAARCGVEGCAEPSVGSRNIGGLKIQRCLKHTQEAEREQANDILRATCERAERLGATIKYLHEDVSGRLPVIPPKGYQQAELRCNADELEVLCESWERHARQTSGVSYIPLPPPIVVKAPPADPRTEAARLLRALAPLIASYQTGNIEDLSKAIAGLNECREGTEGQHWLAVGAALLDLESED